MTCSTTNELGGSWLATWFINTSHTGGMPKSWGWVQSRMNDWTASSPNGTLAGSEVKVGVQYIVVSLELQRGTISE